MQATGILLSVFVTICLAKPPPRSDKPDQNVNFLVEVEDVPTPKKSKEQTNKDYFDKLNLFKSVQLLAEEFIINDDGEVEVLGEKPDKAEDELNLDKKSYDEVLDATEPNELSGWNCPCLIKCDDLDEGSNLRDTCEKGCAKTCQFYPETKKDKDNKNDGDLANVKGEDKDNEIAKVKHSDKDNDKADHNADDEEDEDINKEINREYEYDNDKQIYKKIDKDKNKEIDKDKKKEEDKKVDKGKDKENVKGKESKEISKGKKKQVKNTYNYKTDKQAKNTYSYKTDKDKVKLHMPLTS